MSPIDVHVLDLVKGQPVQDLSVTLELQGLGGTWRLLGRGRTDADGRSGNLLPTSHRLQSGTYRLRFDTAAYFQAQRVSAFYPEVTVVFTVREPAQRYHIPLLLSPFGYSTYRGS